MNGIITGLALEAQRQQDLLRSLRAAPSSRDARGLRAYRSNAHASGERALSAACPTVLALLGGADFAQLAREFWSAHPPQRGDLGVWGSELPNWLESHPALRDWPYLGDCARLDLALHHCERAADASLDADSIGLLASTEPAQLRLLLMPGVQVLVSRWPLVSIHAAHAANDDSLFDLARNAIQTGRGEAMVVARQAWRGCVQPINTAGAAFMQALVAGVSSLALALDKAPVDFDFSAWLADALRHHWVKELRPLSNDRVGNGPIA